MLTSIDTNVLLQDEINLCASENKACSLTASSSKNITTITQDSEKTSQSCKENNLLTNEGIKL